MFWNIVFGIIAICLVAFASIMLIPATRKGGATIEIRATAEHILTILRDVENQPAWRKEIRSIEITDDGWIEISDRDIRTEFRWVSVTAEKAELSFHSGAGYSGTWVANFQPTADGTRMDVVEQVTIPNPVSRLMARIFFDPDGFSRTYLDQLKGKVEK